MKTKNKHGPPIDPSVVARYLSPVADRWDAYEIHPPATRPPEWRGPWMDRIAYVYVSKVYIVQGSCSFMVGDRMAFVLAIRRINGVEIRESWSEIQRIVRDLVPETMWGYEVYPPEDHLVNEAPMRWVWVLHDGMEPVPMGLHRKGLVGDRR